MLERHKIMPAPPDEPSDSPQRRRASEAVRRGAESVEVLPQSEGGDDPSDDYDTDEDALADDEAIEIEALAAEQAEDAAFDLASDQEEDEEDGTEEANAPSSGSSLLPVPSDAGLTGSAQASALTAYMAQLRHYAPISREEEHELAVRWIEDGDVEAARQLVLSNLRLVVKIAMEYRRAWTNTLDLIQEGNVGLAEAVQRFDPYQGVKLSSYAVYWIRAYILKYILDNMRSVRLGTTRASRKLFFRLNKEKRALERQGYEVEPRLLAERLDVSEDDVIDMEARLSRPDMSFDAPLRADESDGMTFGDRMAAPGVTSEATVGANELREVFLGKIAAFAEDLGERDQQILEERILAEEPRTLADLGEEFGVTRERVRQLEAKLVKRLRTYMEENLVDFEYYSSESIDS
jgi:RNA polymerase sigma-32 factor